MALTKAKTSEPIEIDVKYLVIGTKIESREVLSYEWEDVPNDLNLADFNRVIIDLYNLNPENIEYFRLQNHNINNLVFNNNAEIIVIGIPGGIEKGSTIYSTTWWLPVQPKFRILSGDTFKKIKDGFKYYFGFVDKWYFHFENVFQPINNKKLIRILKELSLNVREIHPNYNVLAENIYGKPLALGINYFLDIHDIADLRDSATIIWLPPPTKVETKEAIIEILKERYQIVLSQDEPEWAKRYKLPDQFKIEDKLKSIDRDIRQLDEQKQTVIEELQGQLYFKKLLYEKGEALEKVVLQALKILGAGIQEVKEEKTEDGRIVDPYGRNYMIEIKGRNGQLNRSDIRQLDDWIKKAFLEEHWEGKGIIIGNYFCNMNLTEREYPIHDNEKKSLKRFEFSVIKTSQLFRALRLVQENQFQKKSFWDTVYTTNGLCSLVDIE